MGKIPDDLRETIADNIRNCRRKKFPGRGGSKKCAEEFGVSPQQWSPWECGKRTPSEDRMKEIAKFFGVTVAYLRHDRRRVSDNSSCSLQFPVPPDDGQSHPSPPSAEVSTPPDGTTPSHGETPRDTPPPQFDESPQTRTALHPGSPRVTGQEPQSGIDTYWLLARFFSTISHTGIIVRLTPQDMDYLGDCIAQALVRRGAVFPPQR